MVELDSVQVIEVPRDHAFKLRIPQNDESFIPSKSPVITLPETILPDENGCIQQYIVEQDLPQNKGLTLVIFLFNNEGVMIKMDQFKLSNFKPGSVVDVQA